MLQFTRSLDAITSIFYCITAFLLYLVALAVYRLYFSPLAKFPGPKLAALSTWYEAYYDLYLEGQYQWKIKEFHKRYGPIVRVTPFELHIDDPEFYDQVYVGSSVRRTDKYARSAIAFGNTSASHTTIPHALHRERRAPLSKSFSKKSVADLIPIAIQPRIDKFCKRLLDFKHTGNVVNVVNGFEALTVDIITEYSFGKSLNHLDVPDFSPDWGYAMRVGSFAYHIGHQWPIVTKMMAMLPDWFLSLPDDRMKVYPAVVGLVRRNVEETRREYQQGSKQSEHPTIFHALLDSSLPPEELTTQRLTHEAITVVTAGSTTTSVHLSRTTFELLSNPSKLETLRKELSAAEKEHGSPLTLPHLEQLPYLGAVITEGLRLTYGVIHRLMRVSPDTALHYDNHTIPPNTPVGMSAMFMHNNPTHFPNPRTFIPERYLDPDEKRRLEKYLVPFSKGSRQCVGMQLANAELLLTIYALFKVGGVGEKMKLYETDVSDLEPVHDFFNIFPKKETHGLRVLIE